MPDEVSTECAQQTAWPGGARIDIGFAAGSDGRKLQNKVHTGSHLLFSLTLMRSGANSVEGYKQLLTCLRPHAKIDLSGFTAGWGHSYRRPIPMAKHKERKIEQYLLKSAWTWLQISKSHDSATTYALVLKYLGGTAKFTAYQIYLDLGYKHPHPYDEDAHVVCGPGCEMTAEQVQEFKAELQFWQAFPRILRDSDAQRLLHSKKVPARGLSL